MKLRGLIAREPAALAFLGVAAVLTTAAGILSGNPVVLLALNVVPAWLVFIDRMSRERRTSALWLMVAWAVIQSLCVILATRLAPEKAAAAILHGPAYRDEMFTWIRTGQGPEGNWRLFLPQHAIHYGVFLVVSALTAGLAGLVMGTALLNYMNFYVGELFRADAGGQFTTRLILMSWPVWSIARVVGFIAGAVAATELTLAAVARLRDRPSRWPGRSSYYLSLSLALVILDALVKALLAPTWRASLLEVLTRGR